MIIDIKNINGLWERYSINKNGKEHDLYRSWDSNGNLCDEANYKDGKEHGFYCSWRSNGSLSHEINNENGKEHGLYRFWYLSGNLWNEINYKNGKNVAFPVIGIQMEIYALK